MPQIFVDMDGVLADFDTHHENHFGYRPGDKRGELGHDVDWEAVRKVGNFYRDIPPMKDAHVLWGYVSRLTPKPIILTGIPHSTTIPEAAGNKREWVRRITWIGPSVEVHCCLSKEKYLHCKPGDILIDDWEKYRHLWVGAGGRWITHSSAEDTIRELFDMGVGL